MDSLFIIIERCVPPHPHSGILRVITHVPFTTFREAHNEAFRLYGALEGRTGIQYRVYQLKGHTQ